jgi:GDPmannose 4,6-dehydratase
MPAYSMIIGSDGQDGLVLQELLRLRNKNIIKVNRSQIVIDECQQSVLLTEHSLKETINNFEVSEIYFLASVSTPASEIKNLWSPGRYREDSNLIQLFLNILDVVKSKSKMTKIFVASSALIFGNPKLIPQDEECLLAPTENYGLFKSLMHSIIDYYQVNYKLHIVTGILYPHESKYRKSHYLFKKIINTAKSNEISPSREIEISNMNYTREWNCAYQVMGACIDLMELDCYGNFVIGSGVQYTVGAACEIIFSHFGLDSKDYVVYKNSPLIERSPNLVANPTKLKNKLGYVPDGDLELLIQRNY